MIDPETPAPLPPGNGRQHGAGGPPDEQHAAFQLAMADRLRPLSSPNDIVATASEMLGQHLHASRVVYAEVDAAEGTFFIRRQWGTPGAADISGQARRLDDFGPEVIALLRGGQAMMVQDVSRDARTRPYRHNYDSIGVRANLAVPLLKSGAVAVVLSVHDAQPRAWTDNDVQLVQEVAERTWMAVETVRAEAQLRETQAWLSAMFESLPVGVGVFDATGMVKLANQAMHRYMPTQLLPSKDPSRQPRWQLSRDDGSPVAPKDFPGARALRGERVVPGVEALYTQDDGRQLWTEVAAVPIRDAQGRVSGQVSVVHEIDALKRTEAALRRSEERYRALFLKMDAGFCIMQVLFDAQGEPVDLRYVETNPMFERQTGMRDVVGRTLRELVPDVEGFWTECFAAIVRTGEPARFDRYSEAFRRWFDVDAFRVGDPHEHLVAVLFTDITRRRDVEEELRRLAADLGEANRRQSEFLAVLAHELRNPLAPILTGLELMRLRPDNREVAARAREIVERQTRQMVHLIDDLLDIARVTSGKIEMRRQALDLRAAIATAVETSLPGIEKAGHAIDVQLHDAALPLWADPTRLAQIVSNLLTNAAKYTPAGGKIRLAVTREGEEAVVSVTDNGLGIPKESLSTIFDMFSQLKRDADASRGGLGIGLALVKQLVALHGGTVSASSEGPGRGSTFVVRLPLVQAQAAAAAVATATSADVQARVLRILVADDNVDAAQSMAALLGIFGHETQVVHDGPQALAAARDGRPDVVFLDIGMPGMSGYEVARQLRTLDALQGTTLVALTGWGTEDDRAKARETGFDGHFTKPVGLEALRGFLDGVGR